MMHDVQYLPVGILSSLIMVINIFFSYRKHHRVLQLLQGATRDTTRHDTQCAFGTD
jgi:sensor c-di-GMP phosphodiesterase-like protein